MSKLLLFIPMCPYLVSGSFPGFHPNFDTAVLILAVTARRKQVPCSFSSCPREQVLPDLETPELGNTGLKKRMGKK